MHKAYTVNYFYSEIQDSPRVWAADITGACRRPTSRQHLQMFINCQQCWNCEKTAGDGSTMQSKAKQKQKEGRAESLYAPNLHQNKSSTKVHYI